MQISRTRAATVLLLLTSALASAAEKRTAPAEILEQARRDLATPGLSAAIVVNDKIVFADGFGMADVENEVAATAESVYRLGSISKPITATALLQLVEQGRVDLGDSIRKYAPSFPAKGDYTITLRHILTHTSGIRHYRPGEFDHPIRYETVADAIGIFKDDPLLFPPGERYSYSSYAFNLLAAVVERASGLGFEQYVRRNVFEPAGMNSARFDRHEPLILRRVRQYTRDGGRLQNAPYADLSVKWAGGGMLASALDLARFHVALDRGRLLAPETLAEMYEPRVETGRPGASYGYGWQIFVDEEGTRWVAHGGGATGGTTYLLRRPESGLAVVLLTNLEGAKDLRGLALRLAAEVGR